MASSQPEIDKLEANLSKLQGDPRLPLHPDTIADLLSKSPVGHVVIDASGAIRYVNEQVTELFGYGQQELIGRPVETLMPERFRAAHQQYRQQYIGSPKPRRMGANREIVGLKKNGDEFRIEVGLDRLRAPNEMLYVAYIWERPMFSV